jgi:laminin alpha 3/5
MIPDVGCQECDSCVHLLVDDTEYILGNVSTMIRDLSSISVGVLAVRRLEKINQTVYELRPAVDRLTSSPPSQVQLDPLVQEVQRVQDMADRINTKSDRTHRESNLVEIDSSDAKTRAMNIYDEVVRAAVDAANDAVNYVQNIVNDIRNNIGQSNLDELLRQAERMLDEMKRRDFTQSTRDAQTELQRAIDALRRARELLDRAMEQANRTSQLTIRIEDITHKLSDLRNHSRSSMGHSDDAKQRNSANRQVINHILELIKEISVIEREVNSCQDRSRQLLIDARRFLDEARVAYSAVERELSRLDVAIDRIKPFIDNLESENRRLRPLVDQAMEHARNLRDRADELDGYFSETRRLVETAINASRSYQSITRLINEALNASLEAMRAADEANRLSSGHADEARDSLARSVDLKGRADDTVRRLDDEVRPRIKSVNTTITDIETIIIELRDGLSSIGLSLDMLPDRGYGEEARAAVDLAMDAQKRAEEAETKVEMIVDKLPEDQRKVEQIPIDIDTANRNIKDAQIQVNKVQELVPTAIDLLNRLNLQATRIRQLGIELRNNISNLRSQIEIARNHANLIKVGVQFDSSSQLWVKNPWNLQQGGSRSRLSFYFRTEQPDGFLAYIGPDASSTSIKDYMVVEIINGRVQFKYDLGSGPAIILSDKIVNTGQWHHVIAERTGKEGKLTVRWEIGEEPLRQVDFEEKLSESPGTTSVLELTPTTRFFVGGVLNRDADALLSSNVVSNTHFVGCLEEPQFNGVAVGLWNFMEAASIHGCQDRGRELPVQPPEGLRFGGNGYVMISRGNYRTSQSSAVRFDFRTFSPDGLMFLMGKERDYLSVEMSGGRVVARYDLGSGPAKLSSDQNNAPVFFNDGKWHTLFMNRVGYDGILKIDGLTMASGRSSGSLNRLEIDDEIFIGGYKGEHPYRDVTQKGFEGCIKNLVLGSTPKDINENLEIKDIEQGCTEVSRLASFRREIIGSYLGLPSVDINGQFQMSFTLKSDEQDGLIFYVANTDAQKNALSVSVVGGKIVVKLIQENTELAVLESTASHYGDGNWHYVTISKNNRNLNLDIDDSEYMTSPQFRARGANTNSLSYLGGVPADYALMLQNVGLPQKIGFAGCVADVIINGQSQNFASVSPQNMFGVTLESCHIPDPTPPPQTFTPRPTQPGFVPPTGALPEKCRLPLDPVEPDLSTSEGVRFGLVPESRYEYNALPSLNSRRAEFSIDFKTSEPNGTLFYVTSDQRDFIGLYMKNGQIGFAFNCGSGSGRKLTTTRYDDDRWHTVVFRRTEKRGSLAVDGDVLPDFTSRGRLKTVEVDAPFYFGGMPSGVAVAAASKLDDVQSRFIGCMRNLRLDGNDLGRPDYQTGTGECYQSDERGVFFYADGGHVIINDNFSVPLDLQIDLEIKPRTMSGVILSVYNHGTGPPGGDYIVLQMIDGSVSFSLDNGHGEIKSVYQPATKNELCDGQWHTVSALKTKNVVTLKVDEVNAAADYGKEAVSHTNTHDPLYVGGVPEMHRGIQSRDQYVGCMRNLALNNEPVSLADSQPVGRVNLGSCPST